MDILVLILVILGVLASIVTLALIVRRSREWLCRKLSREREEDVFSPKSDGYLFSSSDDLNSFRVHLLSADRQPSPTTTKFSIRNYKSLLYDSKDSPRRSDLVETYF